uniref:EOG090X0HBC n=1 Tax=Moina brachiata TaxID=675436 RepID=A0A4Y7NJD7_9CRUS|nr:EOG090X0HBC [Moina brachiata]SVE93351.1 EOG090X0HBC [Moina brachiata]
MLFMTWIARVGDGLPLAASIPENEESGRGALDYQSQAKMLFRKFNSQSAPRGTIQTGPCYFHYLLDQNVCYLVLCEQSYSKKLAFSFLEDLAQEFSSLYGKRVQSVNRPYSFIEFDTYIQKARRSFMDSRTRRNLTAINTELQDVQRIMVRNIDDVLQRGSLLSDLDNKAQNLALGSQRYKNEARRLNMQSTYAKIGAAAICVIVFVLYFWRISNLHHKLLVNRLRAAEHRNNEAAHTKTIADRRWDTNYTWNVDDDEEIPGTVRIVLSASDPQKSKNQVVYSIPDRCFIPATAGTNAIEIFDQPSWSVYVEPVAANETQAGHQQDLDATTEDDTNSEAFDGTDHSIEHVLSHHVNLNGSGGNNAQQTTLDTSRSDPTATERDEEHAEPLSPSKVFKRKGAKGINHFSYCDRATQTTVPPIRSHTVQTEAPSRVSFGAMINSWIIFDAYRQDIVAQQQKIRQQQNNAADVVSKAGSAPSSVAGSSLTPSSAEPSASTGAGGATAASATASTFLMQPASESVLSPAGVTRLDSSARVIERMLNQNTYDDIAQDFKYWEDAADEYREPEGTLMPLWRFAPPASLLRMFEENGSMRNQVPSHVTTCRLSPDWSASFL